MSALRHPSQREEMSSHCRHPERVSAKDPVIFYAVMPRQSSSKRSVGDPLYYSLHLCGHRLSRHPEPASLSP